MTPILTLLSPYVSIAWPKELVGWASVFVFYSLAIYMCWYWRAYNNQFSHKELLLFLILFAATPLTSLFIGLRLPQTSSLPIPDIPSTPQTPIIMVFSALPWILAGGMLGPLPAFILAIFSGTLKTLWHSHQVFYPIEIGILAILFSIAVRQRFRTPFFTLLRHPLVSVLCVTLLFPVIYLMIEPFAVKGGLIIRSDYAISSVGIATLAFGTELLIAGAIAEITRLILPNRWGMDQPLIASPAEQSLQNRFLLGVAPIGAILVLALIASTWFIAGKVAKDMLELRMENIAEIAAENIPYFLETGQDLTRTIAKEPHLKSQDPVEVTEALKQVINSYTIFNQLTVVDSDNQTVGTYPSDFFIGSKDVADEQLGIENAQNGMPNNIYVIPPSDNQTTAQISFLAVITNTIEQPSRVLIGRTDLIENTLVYPTISSLANMGKIGGEGILLDEKKRILFHPDRAMVMSIYPGQISDQPRFFDSISPDGKRLMVYSRGAKSRPWLVILTVPAYRIQQMALTIALPLLAIIIVLAVAAFIILRVSVRVVTSSLQTLTQEAVKISQGRLDQPLLVEGVDEVGQLRRSFEEMRTNLKSRLDELNRLLLVSQGVASSLEVSEAVQPVLESVLVTGGKAARIVLSPSIIPELEGNSGKPICFGLGPSNQKYAHLDEQLLALTRQQERLVLPNLLRPRLLTFAPGNMRPESLIAVALRHETQNYGVLWVAYDLPHTFNWEEVRFIVTVAGQAALAASNSRLFLTAEIGRKRMESILASSPDPILVTDQNDRLLLANPAAWQTLGLGMDTKEGQPIDQVISTPELMTILRTSTLEKDSIEISLSSGRIFLAIATPVLAEGKPVGRVCILRDITKFKDLDALKLDFVSTVSHDLRSPLTLIRGYATMLEMVGQLNEQQSNYVRKIVSGTENMSRLVNNLLDLGRIEAGVGLQLENSIVQEIVERVVSQHQIQATQKHIQLIAEYIQNTPIVIEADPALLQQALSNLIENAINYSKPDGKVIVRVSKTQGGILFEIMDNGIGISPMDQPHLFEKFYRGAQIGPKEQRGTGLGLAIVKSIMDRHNGKVWAESQLGKGSTFYVTLPSRQIVNHQ